MKKFIKIGMITAVVTLQVLVPVLGMTLFYAAKGHDGLHVYVEANTTPNALTTSSSGYNLQANKKVSKVTIWMREGDFYQTKSTASGFIQIKKTNNPFHKATADWIWTYER